MLAIAALGVQGRAGATTWYVTAGGTGSGTAAAPFGKIQDAANTARAGDTVLVAPGVYHETITMTHSGTAQAPIVFRSQQPGAAVVSGADPVGSFTAGGASGSWISGAVPVFSSPYYQDEQCFAGGTRLPIARWPYTAAAALSSPASLLVKSTANQSYLGYNSKTQMQWYQVQITLDPGVTPPAGDWTNALVQMNVGMSYQEVSGVVTAVSSSGGSTVLTVAYGTPGPTLIAANELYLSGVTAALASSSGQWIRSGNKILVRAPGDANPNSADIECKQRDFAFDLTGQSYVTVYGFGVFAASITTDRNSGDTSENASWTLHTGQGNVAAANHIVLDHLTVDTPNSIRNLFGNVTAEWTNNTGVVLSGSNNLLQYSTILHADANGVSLAGSGNKVLYNRISESNLVGCECAGISTGYRGVTSVSNPTPQQWAWTWNIGEEIGYNVLERSGRALINISSLATSAAAPSRVHHNVMSGAVLQTYDNGAIYSTEFPYETAQVQQSGLEIDHNIITASPVGIYLDVWSDGLLMHHNIISAAGEPYLTDSVIVVNAARNHQIYNNTLIGDSNSIYSIYDWQPTFKDSGMVVRNNIMRANSYLQCTPGCQDHTLVWDGVAGSATDPRLHNAATVDFSLNAGSPAINAGAAITGITDDSRPGSQVAVGQPDLGAVEYGSTSWVPSTAGDVTAPTVTLSTPAEGASYKLNQWVKASYSCADDPGGSGVARCSGNARNRDLIDTFSVGAKTFSVTATDRAGNNVTVVRHYTVSY